jgi:hypothetical protein
MKNKILRKVWNSFNVCISDTFWKCYNYLLSKEMSIKCECIFNDLEYNKIVD